MQLLALTGGGKPDDKEEAEEDPPIGLWAPLLRRESYILSRGSNSTQKRIMVRSWPKSPDFLDDDALGANTSNSCQADEKLVGMISLFFGRFSFLLQQFSEQMTLTQNTRRRTDCATDRHTHAHTYMVLGLQKKLIETKSAGGGPVESIRI